MKQILCLVLFLCISNSIKGQKATARIPDSLMDKSYTYLDDQAYEFRKDTLKATVYLNTYLSKAKNENNWKEIIYAYQNLVHQVPDKLKLVYADSMVSTAKKANDNSLIGSAILSRGIVFYGRKDYQQAFDNYIIANNFISQTDDQYLTTKVKYHMAQIKYYLGFYDEAISLFNECLDFFKNENPRAYLNTLHSIGVCYNRIGDYGLCSQTNEKGLLECIRLENNEMKSYFTHSDGINDFFKHNYNSSISKIESSLTAIKENNDFANESLGDFYIGKSFWDLNKKEKAIPYFSKVDQAFINKNFIHPDQREMYEMLIDYYDDKKDLKKELYNVKQLLKADKLLKETYSYLVSKIHKNYDTKELQLKNKKIEQQLIVENYFDWAGTAIIIFLFSLAVYLTNRHYKNKKLYREKFDQLMLDSENRDANKPKIYKKLQRLSDIPQETIEMVLTLLDKFESENKFLTKDIKQADLAAYVHTNSKYLYKILSYFKNKSFIQYINDLRIDYIVALLREDKRFRKYSYAALADEAGFSTTQQFSLVFRAKTGMPVNYFIKEISK